MCSVIPLRFHEMHMGIPEISEDSATVAGDRFDAPRGSQMLADSRDHPMPDHHCRIAQGPRFRRGVDRRMSNRKILCGSNIRVLKDSTLFVQQTVVWTVDGFNCHA